MKQKTNSIFTKFYFVIKNNNKIQNYNCRCYLNPIWLYIYMHELYIQKVNTYK